MRDVDGSRLYASLLDGRYVDALEAVPCSHLECTLSHLDDDQLKGLARIHAEPNVFEGFDRKALVEFVKKETLSAGYLEEVLLHLPPNAREWLFFLLDEGGMARDVPIRPVRSPSWAIGLVRGSGTGGLTTSWLQWACPAA